MKLGRKLLTIALVTMALMSVMVMGASAEDIGSEADLKTALTTGGEYTLTDDITLTGSITIPEGVSVTLNTADFTITYKPEYGPEINLVAFAITNYGSLTITGVEGTNTAITNYNNESLIDVADWTYMTKDEAEFVADGAHIPGIIDNYGTFKASNVTFYSDNAINSTKYEVPAYTATDLLALLESHAGTVELTNVNSLSLASDAAKTAVIGLAAFRSEMPTASVIINGGVYVSESREESRTSYALTANVTDGAYINPAVVYGYRGALGLNAGGSEVAGGDYYSYKYRNLYFSGDRESVYMTISGGSFNRLDGEEKIINGNVLYIANNDDDDGGLNLPAVCTIEGGTFNGDIQVNTPLGALHVSGGTFNHIDVTGDEITADNIMNYLVEDANITIGDTFTIDSNTTIPAGATVTLADDASLTVGSTYTLTISEGATLDVATGTLINSGTIGNNGTIVVNDATALETAIAAGGTVKLGSSFTLSSAISVTDDVTLDLNGKTITGNTISSSEYHFNVTDGAELIVTGAGTITNEDARIFYVEDGKLTLENGEYNAYVAVGIKGSASDDESYSIATIGKNAAINADYGAFVTHNNSNTGYGAEIHVYGTITGTTTLYINGYNDATEGNVPAFYIYEDAELNGSIYAAGYSKWFFGDYTFADGFEIKGGEFETHEKMTFNASDVDQSHIANGSGTSTSGYALAVVDNVGYAGADVTINGGTFNGDILFADEDNTTQMLNSNKEVVDNTTYTNKDGANNHNEIEIVELTIQAGYTLTIQENVEVTLSGAIYNYGTIVDADGNDTLASAKIITFDAGTTGTCVAPTIYAANDQSITLPTAVGNTYYTFTGWSDGTTTYTGTYTVTNEDVTLTAQYSYYKPSSGSNNTTTTTTPDTTTTTDTTTSDNVTVETESTTTTNSDGSTTTETVETATNSETGEVVSTTSTETSVENDDGSVTTEIESTSTNETTGEVTSTVATATTTTTDDGATVTETVATTTNETTGDVTESTSTETVTDTTTTTETVAETITSAGDVIAETSTVIVDSETATEITATVATENGETTTAEIVAVATEDTTEVIIPQTVLDTVAAEETATITVQTAEIEIVLDVTATNTVASAVAEAEEVHVVITAEKVETDVVDEAHLTDLDNLVIVDLTITIGDNTVSDLGGGTATVAIPYTKSNSDAPVTVYYVADDGVISAVSNFSYDESNGVIYFTTSHFSYYMVSENTAISFTDVAVGSWYYDAVKFAVENGITSGTSTTEFSPDMDCTRAQIVTFLYRAAGEPNSEIASDFTDLDGDAYYYDAILWAVENGITSGVSDTEFAPDLTCTRAQIVTFLYRLAGEPDVSGDIAFGDVDADAYYANAVLWAVENGITTGISDDEFAPDSACTRAQVVTFIYRYMGE